MRDVEAPRSPLYLWVGFPEGFEAPEIGDVRSCGEGLHVVVIEQQQPSWLCCCGRESYQGRVAQPEDLPFTVILPDVPVADEAGRLRVGITRKEEARLGAREGAGQVRGGGKLTWWHQERE